MSIRCRMYTPDDIDMLVKFWGANSGWDQIDRQEWERRFYHTPHGPAAVVLAEDEATGEMDGQFLFIPTVVSLDGKQLKGYRPFAPVVKESLRSELGFMTLIEVVMKMYTFAMDAFKKDGVSLVHMLPDPRWAKAFSFLPGLQIHYFPLWSHALPLAHPFDVEEEYTVAPLEATDPRIDDLWEKQKLLYGCCAQRTSASLPWKISHGNYRLLGLFRSGELQGLSASIWKGRDKQWLICDLMAADAEATMDAMLKATCNFIHSEGQRMEMAAPAKIAILATELLIDKLSVLGFHRDEYRFPMVVQVLDDSIPTENAAPSRWYASAND